MDCAVIRQLCSVISSLRQLAHGQEVAKTHHYRANLVWTGNLGAGTKSYLAYDRGYEIRCPGKPPIIGSADPAFRGNPAMHNPEELLVASVSACHMLWYLHLCSAAGLIVSAYEDAVGGSLSEDADGTGRFTEMTLRPRVMLAGGGDAALAQRLHAAAHEKCFIANSVNFPIRVEPTVTLESGSAVP
jgi:organic hydroperoxide reductase OsmC/OhrA